MNLPHYKWLPGIFIFLYISLVFSCADAKHSKTSNADDWYWAKSFPEKKFSSAILFALDSSVKETIYTEKGSMFDTSIFLGSAACLT
jgi:hypothetical protein